MKIKGNKTDDHSIDADPINDEGDKPQKKLVAKKIAVGTLNVVFPVKAVFSSIAHFKKSTKQTFDNASYIKDMAMSSINRAKNTQPKNDNFDDAIQNSNMNVHQLMNIFIVRKNFYLIVMYLGTLVSLVGFIFSINNINYAGILFSGVAMFSIFGLFFLLAFSNQFRIWQLQVRRLSFEENGGINFFIKDSAWLINTLKIHKKVIER